jgi:hypothetical protein
MQPHFLHEARGVGKAEWLAMYDRVSPEAHWKVSGPDWVCALDSWVCYLHAYDALSWWSLPFAVRLPRPVPRIIPLP